MHPKLPLWIVRSCRVFFDARRGGYPLYAEHTQKPTDAGRAYGELKVDGPFSLSLQGSTTLYEIEVNILCTCVLDPRDSDVVERLIGQFVAAFDEHLPIFKIGDGNEYIDCMSLRHERGERLRVNRFGQVQVDTGIAQAGIEGHYEMKTNRI